MSAPENCIVTENLTHRFGSNELVVQDVNLVIPRASIYGFLGPNGAGKTTTLRLILGLLQKQQGKIYIKGMPLHKHRTLLMRSIGNLIESPSIYAHLSATENVRIQQILFGTDRKRIQQVLQLVGLEKTGSKPAGKFSLGMKQRLGIAIALLHSPEILILDEPTNGLDPNGMIEIRELLLRLHKENGMTILVSSHLLAEIEKLATHVGVIHNGILRFQGSTTELADLQRHQKGTLIATDNIRLSKQIFDEQGISYHIAENVFHVSVENIQRVVELNRTLNERGVGVFKIEAQKHDIETIFMELIK